MRVDGRVLGFAIAVAALLLAVGPSIGVSGATTPNPTTASSHCQPSITSVSGLSVNNLYHRIVIRGSCLGKNPTYLPVSFWTPYNGSDSLNCGTGPQPSLRVAEWGSSVSWGDWSAGRVVGTGGTCTGGDAIGLTYSSWTPTKIVIGHGFGDALGSSTQNSGAPWLMTPNTPCAVGVFNPGSATTFANFTLPLGTC
jgi:hypothetical protein